MENLISTEKDHLQQAKLHFNSSESPVVTGSGVFYKTKEEARISSEKNDKELVQVGD